MFSLFSPLRMLSMLMLVVFCAASAGCGGSSASRGGAAPKAQPASPPASSVPTVQTAPATPEATPEDVSASGQAAPSAAAPSPAPIPPSAQGRTAAARVSADLAAASGMPLSGPVAECWQPLMERLQNDPNASPEMARYFCSLADYSPDPMAEKVKELFTNAFLRKKTPPDPNAPKRTPSRIYRNIVTAANVQKCNDFLARNKAVFDAVEKKYPVPREVLAALLFVETRLGTYVGKKNAFWSLACMAAADKPELVKPGLSKLPITSSHDAWLQDKLTDKSNWAYKEMRSLLAFCDLQQLDPHKMPGSVYGAVGICQFMPSNLVPYGDDGDGDGVVNLFSEPDAIFSAARYLTKHGWAAGISIDKQRSVLKRYNNLTVYANTILALGESIRTGELLTGPPDAKPAKKK